MNALQLEWVEEPPSPRGRGGRASRVQRVVAELKKRPGKWANVQEGIASTSGASKWKKLGCEAYSYRPDTTSNKCDVYARWPEQPPKAEEREDAAKERARNATPQEVAAAYHAKQGHVAAPAPAPGTPEGVKAQLEARLGHKRPVAR